MSTFRTLEFTRLTSRQCDAARILQKFIIYLDEFLVAISSEFDYLEHLEFIVQLFLEAGLIFDVKKCKLLPPQGRFLGHLIALEGIELDPHWTRKQLRI